MIQSQKKVSFRDCRSDDLEVSGVMVGDFYSTDAVYQTPGTTPDIALTFAEFERHPQKGRVIVIEVDGVVSGYGIIIFFWSNEYRGDIIEIDEVYLSPACRGLGAGRSFFEFVDSEYPQCAGFALQVSHSNSGARKLYESLGFELSPQNHMVKLRRK